MIAIDTAAGPEGGQVGKRIWGRRRQLLAAAGLLSGHQIGEMAVPVVVGFAINDAIAHPRFSHLLMWLIALAVNFATLSVCWRFGSRLGAKVRLGLAHDLRSDVVTRVLDARGIDGGPNHSGEIVTIAVSDARRVGDATRLSLGAVAGIVVLVGSMIAIATISLLLAMVVIFGAVATLAVIALLGHPVEVRSTAQQEASAAAASVAIDMVAGLRVLAGLRAGAAAGARYRKVSHQAVRGAIFAAEAEATVSGIAAFAVGCYLTAIAAVSAELALDGRVSIGVVIAVLGLSQLLLGPLQLITQAVPSIRRGRASAARINALLDSPTVLNGAAPDPLRVAGRNGEATIAASGAVDLEDLRLPGIDALALSVAAGSVHGLVCDSPAAAQSLLQTLAGETPGISGRVQVDGIDIDTVSPDDRRRVLLVWHHNSFPPGDTIAEVVGADVHPPELTAAAIEAAAATEIVERTPGGLSADVGEHGAALSGGERQRLALARVLAERPPALVLHEPTSAVDSVTELQIARAIGDQRRGKTTMIVTTSRALLSVCDRVSLIVDGRLLASGTPDEISGQDAYVEVVGR